MREALDSVPIQSGLLGSVIALDQDPASLQVVEHELGPRGVTPLEGTVRDLLVGGLDLGEFDLIYAAGLYDYLTQPGATKLTRALMRMLRPGGRLLIGNFREGIVEGGYMELFMDWKLVYRDQAAMAQRVAPLPGDFSAPRTFDGPAGRIVYLDVARRV
jgi:SAM-dependent methyltransferase